MTVFVIEPNFSISISIKSPSFRYGTFGLFNATPAAGPVEIPSIISIQSKSMTLEPGDIISTGTAAGVALNNPNVPYLKDGDLIEMEIEKMGSITNTVKFVD